MSELKWNWAYYPYLDPPEKQAESALKAGYIKVVNKSEADKVIAEKDKEIARLNDKALQYKVLDKEHCRDLNAQERRFALQIAHHKYKRCLDKAKWCKDKMQHYKYDDRVILYGFRFYERWHKRWLELAEKFKEAK